MNENFQSGSMLQASRNKYSEAMFGQKYKFLGLNKKENLSR